MLCLLHFGVSKYFLTCIDTTFVPELMIMILVLSAQENVTLKAMFVVTAVANQK
jgi:hypothetical protein